MPALNELLEAIPAPAYAVNAHGVIAWANAALCDWVSLKQEAVIGRRVAYHCESGFDTAAEALTGLCPPPGSGDAPPAEGTLSTMGRDGMLRHRRAGFLWLPVSADHTRQGVIVVADAIDLTPQQLAATLSEEPTHDELHRHVRRFRRTHSEPAAAALLLGDSPAAQRLRSQFDLAVQSGAGALVCGACAADTACLARAIHYARQDAQAQLAPIDCRRLSAAEVLRLVENATSSNLAPSASLLLLEAHALALDTQQRVAELCRQAPHPRRVLATLDPAREASVAPELLALAAPARLDSPPLAQRAADLPALAQFFVEQENAMAEAQRGGVSPDAIDQLAVYDWPHGAAQLGEVLSQACNDCRGAQVMPRNLPPLIRQAVLAASLGTASPQLVAIDQLLEQVEREAIRRALNAAGDNKAEAARLLGLTRQRFYRRLESLGLAPSEEARTDA